MRRSAALLVALLCLPASIATNGASAAGCPDEALRIGPSALLPQCRAYEMASPVVKNGGNVSSTFGVHAAPDGSGVSFGSTASFAGSPASPLGSAYIARRGSGWTTEAVDPQQFNESGLLLRGTPVNSRDLRHSLGVSRLALTPGAREMGSNLYLRDNATGARTLLAATPGKGLFQQGSGAGGGVFIGAGADWSHILIHSNEALSVPAGEPQPAEGVENVYDLSGGQAHLVNVLPDGTVDPTGAHIGSFNMPYQHVMSEDGSRAFFETGTFGSGPLYLRENGTTTVPISLSENGAEAGEMKEAEFGLATADGSVVYFTSPFELIEGAGGGALYRYDVPTRELSAVVQSPPEGGAQVKQVLGAGDDGSYVYFSATAVLAEGATEAIGGVNFYVSHDGTIKFIGQTDLEDGEFAFPQQWGVSPNGKYFGFATATPMTEEDVPSPACPTNPNVNNAPEHCFDVYAYQYETNQLTCASCNGVLNVEGEWEWLPGRGFSELGGQKSHEGGTGDEFSRAVLDDGTFFVETPNALSPRDTNGVGDVYAWRDGVDELISTGTSEQPSTFGDATPDGSNVYFLTTQALVKQDADDSVDVYDDRELGGLASQWPPGSTAPCEGEGCRGASSPAPAGLPEGSALATPGTRLAPICGQLKSQARQASRQAGQLTRRARRDAKRSGAKAKAEARRLRRQAATARKRAHQIHRKATTCGRKG
ncbi:MAG TPA: hypothetical protein VHZ54_11215 [Solirubrobacterales bacterium]|jgi:hypothetical protein|nr:hypothetical protein [Solirubrobacterales bacterium]